MSTALSSFTISAAKWLAKIFTCLKLHCEMINTCCCQVGLSRHCHIYVYWYQAGQQWSVSIFFTRKSKNMSNQTKKLMDLCRKPISIHTVRISLQWTNWVLTAPADRPTGLGRWAARTAGACCLQANTRMSIKTERDDIGCRRCNSPGL